jgi:hypothetical protein
VLALTRDGLVYVWGENEERALLGHVHVSRDLLLKPVEALRGVRAAEVAAGRLLLIGRQPPPDHPSPSHHTSHITAAQCSSRHRRRAARCGRGLVCGPVEPPTAVPCVLCVW